MSAITVRQIRFPFDDAVALVGSDGELGALLPILGLSLTMPYL